MEVAFKNLLTGSVLTAESTERPDLDKCNQLVAVAIQGKEIEFK